VISRVSRYAPGYGSVNANDGDAISAQSVVAVSTLYFISYLHISAQFSNNSKYYCINPIDRTISGVASQAVNTVFSATYNNYRILCDLTSGTSDGFLYLKLRSGTTDNSLTYSWSMNGLTNQNVTNNQFGSVQTTGFFVFTIDTGLSNYFAASMDLFKPFESVFTTGIVQSQMLSPTTVVQSASGGYVHEQSTSYDGFNLIASAGNMTGRVSVYGYNK
jgi:hypothetical protein